MDETQFHSLADSTLQTYFEQLEPAYERGALDELELEGGILTLIAQGKTLLLNKHTASRQLWLASPFSGGLHFGFDANRNHWTLSNGMTLDATLAQELVHLGVTEAS